jgi:hypothetical protein
MEVMKVILYFASQDLLLDVLAKKIRVKLVISSPPKPKINKEKKKTLPNPLKRIKKRPLRRRRRLTLNPIITLKKRRREP